MGQENMKETFPKKILHFWARYASNLNGLMKALLTRPWLDLPASVRNHLVSRDRLDKAIYAFSLHADILDPPFQDVVIRTHSGGRRLLCGLSYPLHDQLHPTLPPMESSTGWLVPQTHNRRVHFRGFQFGDWSRHMDIADAAALASANAASEKGLRHYHV